MSLCNNTSYALTRSSATPHKNHRLLKLDSMGYISFADSISLASVNLMQLASKAVTLCEIMRNDNHKDVQGHSRSQILLPVNNPHATSY